MTIDYHLIIYGVIAYLVGNINPAILVGRLNGIDIKKEGSGNAGTTNVLRVLGPSWALTTLAIDVLKGFIAVRIGLNMAGDLGAMVCFVAVVLGHCFPALYHFKGGKGVATSLGAAFAIDWLSAFALILIALVVVAISKRMSVGSIVAAICYPLLVLYYYPSVLPMAVIMALLVIFMHRSNIGRLIRHEEPKMSFGSKKKENTDPVGMEPARSVDRSDQNEVQEGNIESEIIDEIVEDEIEPETAADTAEAVEAENEEAVEAVEETESEPVEAEMTEVSDEVPAEEPAAAEEADASSESAGTAAINYFAGNEIPQMKASERKKVAVIGGGALPAALANRMVYKGLHVMLHIADKEEIETVRESHVYASALPYAVLSDKLHYTSNVRTAANKRDVVVFADCEDLEETVKKAMRGMSIKTIVVLASSQPIELTDSERAAFRKNPIVKLEIPEGAAALARNEVVNAHVESGNEEAAETVAAMIADERFRIVTEK